MNTTGCSVRLLPLLLLLLSPTLIRAPAPLVYEPDEEFFLRFDFYFGFFDDALAPATLSAAQLTDEVDALLSQTQYFLSNLLQHRTQSKSIHAKALDIDISDFLAIWATFCYFVCTLSLTFC